MNRLAALALVVLVPTACALPSRPLPARAPATSVCPTDPVRCDVFAPRGPSGIPY